MGNEYKSTGFVYLTRHTAANFFYSNYLCVTFAPLTVSGWRGSKLLIFGKISVKDLKMMTFGCTSGTCTFIMNLLR